MAECPPVNIVSPAQGTTLHDARPLLRWRDVPGVEIYRVQMEARVPEGEVLEHVDVQVRGAEFRPPRPLAARRAAVKLLVTTGCAEAPPMQREAAWFYVDMAKTCPPPESLSFDGSTARAAWTAVTGATEYEIEAFRLPEGQSLYRGKVKSPSAVLPRTAGSTLLAVRSYCGSFSGEPIFGVAPSSR